MEDILELLKYVVPSLVTGLVAVLVIKKMLDQENRRHFMELRKENIKHSTPVRLQAHERLILLLERIDPVKVVNRVIQPGMTAKQLQFEIIRSIKEEFEHNITQQLYVSGACWDQVKKAREDAMKLVTVVAGKCSPDADGIEYSKLLIQVQAEQNFHTSATAIETVKSEIKKIF